MKAPGDKQNDDNTKHEKVLTDFFRNFNFGYTGGFVLCQKELTDYLKSAVF